MEGEWHIQLGSLEALGCEIRVGGLDNLDSAAKDSLFWAVDAGDLSHLVTEGSGDGINATLDGEHAVCVGSALLL